jgi:hypothetical protein
MSPDSISQKRIPNSTTASGAVPLASTIAIPTAITSPRPDFLRLPKRGGDPHFGLSRAWYYAAEKRGLISLKRLRARGKIRGVTLVPYDAIRRLIEEATK